MLRRLLGETRFITAPGETPPVQAGVLQIPGAFKERTRVLKLVSDRQAGEACFLYDRASQEATAVLWMTPRGWAAADVEAKITRTEMFAELVRRIAELDGLARFAFHARTLPQTTGALLDDYQADQPDDAASGEAASTELVAADPAPARGTRAATAVTARADYEDFLESGLPGPVVRHDLLFTLTLDTRAVGREIARLGGEARGVSEVLQDRVLALLSLLPEAGVDPRWCRWSTPGQLRAHIRAAIAPWDVGWLDDQGWDLPADSPLVGAIREHRHDIDIDGARHRTLWIQDWPRLPREVGFLDGLVSRAECPHTVSVLCEPVPVEKAEADHRRASQSHESAVRMHRALQGPGQPLSPSLETERRELEARSEEIGLGFGAVRFRGFVTLSGQDKTELAVHEAQLRRVSAALRLATQPDRQYAAFLAALPLGIGVRR
jgi:hypothetical protein